MKPRYFLFRRSHKPRWLAPRRQFASLAFGKARHRNTAELSRRLRWRRRRSPFHR
jgi:hypothetical protein